MAYIGHEQRAMNSYMGLAKADPASYMGKKKEDNYLNKLLTEEDLPALHAPVIQRMQGNGLYNSRNPVGYSSPIKY